MKNTTIRIALGFATLLATSTVLAQESVDCFYEANSSNALCQLDKSVKFAPNSILANGYHVTQLGSDESVDCFYEANHWNVACVAASKRIVLRDRME